MNKNFKKMDQDELQKELLESCKNGDLQTVKYLLNSPDLTNHGIVNYDILNLCCTYDKVNILSYMLSSDKNIDVQGNDDSLFYCAYSNWSKNVLRYLIFDLNIQRTDTVEYCMDSYENNSQYDDICEKNK